MEQIRTLIDTRAGIVKQMHDLSQSDDCLDNEHWDKLEAREVELRKQIEKLEDIYEADARLEERQAKWEAAKAEETRGLSLKVPATSPIDSERSWAEALHAWMLTGSDGLSESQRKKLHIRQNPNKALLRMPEMGHETRFLSATGPSIGSPGVTQPGEQHVPEGPMAMIVEDMKAYGALRRAGVTLHTTAGGNELPIPIFSDIANEGAVVTEGTSAGTTSTDPTTSEVKLNAYRYHSKWLKVSKDYLRDSVGNSVSLITRALTRRVAIKQNKDFTSGNGTNKARGIVTALGTGVTIAKSGSPAAAQSPTVSLLWDLIHSVDPIYRTNAKFMFHDNFLKLFKKLVDGDSRPLWVAGLTMGAPDRLLGHPFLINQEMESAIGDGKDVITFADFSNYHWRDVMDMELIRTEERFVEDFQIGFLLTCRADGDWVDPGEDPGKNMTNAS